MAIYRYKENGQTAHSDFAPAHGTAYELIENGRVVDNGVVGRLSTKQQAAKDRSDAAEARNEAARAKSQAIRDRQEETRAALIESGEKLNAAAEKLNRDRGALFEEIQAINRDLGRADQTHDAIGIALGAAGVIAAIALTGGVALIVGGSITAASWLNSDLRYKNPDAPTNEAADLTGKINDTLGVLSDEQEVLKTTGRWAPASKAFSVAGSGVGFAGAIYEASDTVAAVLEPRIYSSQQLGEFPATIKRYADADALAGRDPKALEEMTRKAAVAQKEYDEALLDFVEKDFAYMAAWRAAAATWSEVKEATSPP